MIKGRHFFDGEALVVMALQANPRLINLTARTAARAGGTVLSNQRVISARVQ